MSIGLLNLVGRLGVGVLSSALMQLSTGYLNFQASFPACGQKGLQIIFFRVTGIFCLSTFETYTLKIPQDYNGLL